jgi:hypothetical protein
MQYQEFFQHCKLSGHWEAKCWRVHPKLHPRNHTTKRRVWRVKGKKKDEGAAIVQEPIAAEDFISTYEMHNRLMPKSVPI